MITRTRFVYFTNMPHDNLGTNGSVLFGVFRSEPYQKFPIPYTTYQNQAYYLVENDDYRVVIHCIGPKTPEAALAVAGVTDLDELWDKVQSVLTKEALSCL